MIACERSALILLFGLLHARAHFVITWFPSILGDGQLDITYVTIVILLLIGLALVQKWGFSANWFVSSHN